MTDARADRVLKQLARELLLAQSSDWAFLMKTGTAKHYATKRVTDHLLRFNRLYDEFIAGSVDEGFLSNCEWRDNLFPDLDWRYYVSCSARTIPAWIRAVCVQRFVARAGITNAGTHVVPAPARNVRISFLPPPLDGTISLGIYDAKGKLVRVLLREADINEFTIGRTPSRRPGMERTMQEKMCRRENTARMVSSWAILRSKAWDFSLTTGSRRTMRRGFRGSGP